MKLISVEMMSIVGTLMFVAHDVIVARPVKHPHPFAGGPALADEVDDSLRTIATGELENLFDVAPVGDDSVVGTDGHRELDGLWVTVDDDELGGTKRLKYLNADVAKSAGTDEDAAVAWGETPRGLGRRVVGGEAGIGKRGDIRGFQGFIDFHDAAGRCLQVLGIPAIGVDARKQLASQCTSSPVRQARHSPQVINGWTMTLSPSLTLVTGDPIA